MGFVTLVLILAALVEIVVGLLYAEAEKDEAFSRALAYKPLRVALSVGATVVLVVMVFG